jgi:hypothetical protein
VNCVKFGFDQWRGFGSVGVHSGLLPFTDRPVLTTLPTVLCSKWYNDHKCIIFSNSLSSLFAIENRHWDNLLVLEVSNRIHNLSSNRKTDSYLASEPCSHPGQHRCRQGSQSSSDSSSRQHHSPAYWFFTTCYSVLQIQGANTVGLKN